MDFCLIADGLPGAFELGCGTMQTDYRHFVRFEAAMLRTHDEQAAARLIDRTLYGVFGRGWREGRTTQQAFDALLWFYRGGRDAPPQPPAAAGGEALAYDYVIDGALIAAAFQQVYGIDLTDSATRIHWWRFQALMQGLPEGCTFSRIVGWRTADLSGLKGRQRAFYQSMKQKFALPSGLGGDKRVYASKADWDAAFIERLRRQAGKK